MRTSSSFRSFRPVAARRSLGHFWTLLALLPGCATILGADFDRPGTDPNAVARGDGGGEGGPGGAGSDCRAGEKACFGGCVGVGDPAFGCGSTSTCDPCSVARGTAACDPGGGQCSVGTCEPGRAHCVGTGASCETNLATDPDHCGRCDKACVPEEVCGPQGCATSCTGGLTRCGRSCVSLETDEAHCDRCDNACPAPANGVATCAARKCGTRCNAGFHDCGGACVPENAASCGPACAPCPGPANGNGVATCNAGACGVQCSPGYAPCAGGCCSTAVGAPSSCAVPGDGRTNCGGGAESCCTSLPVTGGTFSRSYDGISLTDPQYKATVADFRLDKYEVTVGRFRKFVDAVVGGWAPPAGSGKHTHLNGGSGLLASGGGYEPGWDPAWNTILPSVKSTWDSSSHLGCSATYGTWTATEGANERRPINCVNWYQTLAFCIWDGGFLASEAEWNYAAAGGTEQRAYPWSSAYPPGSAAISDANAVYCGGSCASTQNVGSKSPAGNGRYGQVDLAGNVWEWVFDYYEDPYNELSCMNCAYYTSASSFPVIRGGSFSAGTSSLLAGYRGASTPTNRNNDVGARCARTP